MIFGQISISLSPAEKDPYLESTDVICCILLLTKMVIFKLQTTVWTLIREQSHLGPCVWQFWLPNYNTRQHCRLIDHGYDWIIFLVDLYKI